MKKIITLTLALMLLANVFIVGTVNAALISAYSVDFSGYTLNTAITPGGSARPLGLANGSGTSVTLTAQQNIYGNANTSIKLAYDGVANITNPYFQLNSYPTSDNRGLVAGKKLYISTKIALNDLNFTRYGFFAGQINGVSYPSAFLEIGTTYVKVMGQNVPNVTPAVGQWYSVDIIIYYDGTTTPPAEAYFNGIRIEAVKSYINVDKISIAPRYNMVVSQGKATSANFGATSLNIYDASDVLDVEKNYLNMFDFTNATTSNYSGITGNSITAINMGNGTGYTIDSTPTTGVYGKASADTALKIALTAPSPLSTAVNPYYSRGNMAINQGATQKTHVTLQFATDTLNYDNIRIAGTNEFLKVYPDGMVDILGNSAICPAGTIAAKKWYTVDIVGDFRANGTVTAYLNGVSLGSRTHTNDYSSIGEMRLDTNTKVTNTVYFDNFGYAIINNTATPTYIASAINVTTTPLNNAVFLNPTTLNSFVLNWGGEVVFTTASVLLEKKVGDNYVAVTGNINYEKTKFTINFTAEYQTEYRVTVSGFKNLYLDDIPQTVYNFRTKPENSLAPVVTLISPQAKRYNPGSTITLSATATAQNIGATISKVDFYSNGTLIATVNSAPYNFDYKPANGSNSIYAIATDTIGAVAQTNAVQISVVEYVKPVVTVNIAENDVLDKSTARATVSVASNYTIKSVILYIDNRFFGEMTQPPYTFDLSGLSPAKHTLKAVAADDEGSGECTISSFAVAYNIISTFANLTFDFNGLSAPPGGTGFITYNNRGQFSIGTLNDSHKEFFKITDNAALSGGGPWFALKPNAGQIQLNKQYNIGTDVYIPNSVDNINLQMFMFHSTAGVYGTPIINIVNGTITIGSKSAAVSPNNWHNLRLQFQVGDNPSFDFYLDGVYVGSGILTGQATEPADIRITWNSTNGAKDVYIDNISIYSVVTFPYINSVQFINDTGTTSDMQSVPCDVKQIAVGLSGALAETGFDNKFLKLKDTMGNIIPTTITKGSDNSLIVFNLTGSLPNNTAYYLSFEGGITAQNGAILPSAFSIPIRTALGSFDVASMGIFSNGTQINSITLAKGKTVTPKVEIVNKESTAKSVVAVFGIYKQNQMVDIVYKNINLPAGSDLQTIQLDSITIPNDDVTVEGFVWNGFSTRQLIGQMAVIK